MPKGLGTQGAEYVIRLATDIDNIGVQKILTLLDTNKMKAIGLTAALTTATTAVYKFVESATKKEMELQKLAKTQKKTIQQTRAEKEALDAMGMSLNDIKKDAALKSMYDDLVKFNKEMQMPNAAGAIEKVRQMQGAFWKLKSAVSYLVQSVGSQLLINLEKPIERIIDKLSGGANWIKNNLTSIGTKITSYLTAFSKGIIGIVEGVGKIFNWMGQMPEGIKSIAGTIATVFALIKAGPIGQIMALITAAGDLIHDYENSQWNKENREDTKLWNDGNGGWTDKETEFGAYQVPLAYENLWNFLESDTGSLRDKAKTIFTSVLEGIKDALDGFSDTLASGEGLTDWFESLTGPIGDILGGIQDVFSSAEGQEAIGGMINGFLTAASQALAKAGELGIDVVGSVAKMIVNIFGGENSAQIWEDSAVSALFDPNNKNGFVGGLMTSVETALVGGDFWTSLFTGVVSGYTAERNEALKKLFEEDHPDLDIDWGNAIWGKDGGMGLPGITELSEMYGKDSRLAGMLGTGLQESFNTFIGLVLEALVGGINIASDVSGNILSMIVQAIVQGLVGAPEEGAGSISKTIADAMNAEGAKDVFDSIGAGIGTWIVSGNFLTGVFGSIVSFISQSIQTAKENERSLWDVMKEKVEGFWESIQEIIYGPLIDGSFSADGTQMRDESLGLASIIKPLLWGAVDEYEQAFDEVTGEHFKARKGGILNWLLGYDAQKTDAAGNEIEGEVHRVKGIFEKAWEGEDGQGGIKSFFAGLASKIGEWLAPVGDAISNFFKGLWTRIWNEGPQWVKDALGFVGINDPNSSSVKTDSKGKPVADEDGKYTVTSTTGKEAKVGKEQAEFIARHGSNVAIDKDGNFYFTGDQYDYGGESRGSGTNNQLLDWWLNGGREGTGFGYAGWNKYSPFVNGPWGVEQHGEPAPQEPGMPEATIRTGSAIPYESFKSKISEMPVMLTAPNKVLQAYGFDSSSDVYSRLTNGELGEKFREIADKVMIAGDSATYYQASAEMQDFFENNGIKPPSEAKTPAAPAGVGETVVAAGTENAGSLPAGTIIESASTASAALNNLAGEADALASDLKGDNPSSSEGKKPFAESFTADAETFLRTFLPHFSQDEKGNWKPDKSFNTAAQTGVTGFEKDWSGLISQIVRTGVMPADSNGTIFSTASIVQNYNNQTQDKAKGIKIKTTADTSGADAAINAFVAQKSNSTYVTIQTKTSDPDENPTNEAMGGRFDKPFNARVAEAGPEYIIPTSKPERAFSLILQALSEMGSDMIKRVTSHFGGSLSEGVYDAASSMAARVSKDFALGTSGTVGGSLGGIESALQNMQQNFNYNISAPVSIIVNSNANAEDVGRAAYSAAERSLMKTLRGAWA